MRAYSIMLCVVLAGACSKDTPSCPTIASDASWQQLVSSMNLTESRTRRLDNYTTVLEASSCQLARMAPRTRARAAATLKAEIARSIPLFVPAGYRDEARSYILGALGLP